MVVELACREEADVDLALSDAENVPLLLPESDASSASEDREPSRVKTATLTKELLPFAKASEGGPEKDERTFDVGAQVDSTDAKAASGDDRVPKRVHWEGITIRKFPIIPGDHPDCCRGPPLTISWDHFKESKKSIDQYEKERRGKRRQLDGLRLSWMQRRLMLKRVGFDDHDMRSAESEAEKVRKRRERTSAGLRFAKVEEFRQSVLRKLGQSIRPKLLLETKY